MRVSSWKWFVLEEFDPFARATQTTQNTDPLTFP